MPDWMYAIDGQQFGPINSAQLKELAAAGKLAPTDLIWREGLSDWVAAEKVKGLFAAAAAPAASADPVPIPAAPPVAYALPLPPPLQLPTSSPPPPVAQPAWQPPVYSTPVTPAPTPVAQPNSRMWMILLICGGVGIFALLIGVVAYLFIAPPIRRAIAHSTPNFTNTTPPSFAPTFPQPDPIPTQAELDQKLATIPALWQPSGLRQVDLLRALKSVTRVDDIAVVQPYAHIETAQKFRVPATFRIVMQPQGDTRLSYAADQIIFDWEMDQTDLRVDGGPADQKHKPGAGKLPIGQWSAVEWVIQEKQMIIYVDGLERYRYAADFSHIDKPLTIECHTRSPLKIRSLVLLQP